MESEANAILAKIYSIEALSKFLRNPLMKNMVLRFGLIPGSVQSFSSFQKITLCTYIATRKSLHACHILGIPAMGIDFDEFNVFIEFHNLSQTFPLGFIAFHRFSQMLIDFQRFP